MGVAAALVLPDGSGPELAGSPTISQVPFPEEETRSSGSVSFPSSSTSLQTVGGGATAAEPGPSSVTSSSTTSTAPLAGGPAEEPPPGYSPPTGDPETRLRRAAAEAGYPVLRLDAQPWQLTEVAMAAFGLDYYVDSVYRQAQDYLNIAQGPPAGQTVLPNSQALTVRGHPGQVLDMGGLTVLQWDEGGSRVTATSDLSREVLLGLLEQLEVVR